MRELLPAGARASWVDLRAVSAGGSCARLVAVVRVSRLPDDRAERAGLARWCAVTGLYVVACGACGGRTVVASRTKREGENRCSSCRAVAFKMERARRKAATDAAWTGEADIKVWGMKTP